MRKTLMFACVVFLAMTTSCESRNSIVEVEDPVQETIKFDKNLAYLSGQNVVTKEEVSNFIGSFTRTAKTENRDALNAYDFGKTRAISEQNGSREVALVPSSEQDGEFLAVFKSQSDIVGVNVVDYKDNGNGIHTMDFKGETGKTLFSMKYNFNQNTISVTYVDSSLGYTLRAPSGAAWGCGLSLGAVGGMWGTVIGVINPIAGFAVGMAYSAFAIWACDGL